MFGSLGGAEILFILVLALLLFGPRKLPEIGKTVGRAMAEFRKATYDLRSNLEHEVAVSDLRETRKSLQEVGDDLSRTLARTDPGAVAREAPPPADAPPPPGPNAPTALNSPIASTTGIPDDQGVPKP